jgi:hypothetical protein
MILTKEQEQAVNHLRAAFVGPEGGPDEVIVNGRPNLQYTVGLLHPPEALAPFSSEGTTPDSSEAGLKSDVEDGEIDEIASSVPLAEDWRPSSVAISFVTDGSTVRCDVSGGTYQPVESEGPPKWQRTAFTFDDYELSASQPPLNLKAGGVDFQLGSRWRAFGDAWLVTVHIRVLTASVGDSKADAALTLYQVGMSVRPAGCGRILEYDTYSSLDADQESAELRLRYRNRKTYAVGHGMAADWDLSNETPERVFLSPVPAFVVPAVETIKFDTDAPEAKALRLDYLSTLDSNSEAVTDALDRFVEEFFSWVAKQQDRVNTFGAATPTAQDIVDRSRIAAERMASTVSLLRQQDQHDLRTAFALGMAAMRMQMRQSRVLEGETLESVNEPLWRPFQLGFILVSLSSVVNEEHSERELVDLIWFPTGGGKTEAYLGLAAIEMFRRRLVYGVSGGGTAVITRYTLRLLTAQQFHRATSLICAMELLRQNGKFGDSRANGLAPFSIGLWVGNDVTPGTRLQARQALDRLLKAARPDEASQFQIESCPWCGTSLLPLKHSPDPDSYGIHAVGNDIVIRCIDQVCPFTSGLPIAVVDEVLYENPPSFLLATVDKFARLQFKLEAGRLLGLGTISRQPSMIIQDELHLLSGPLGTTVALFDAAIQILLQQDGSAPKIIASTATIRASNDQVRGLYGRDVALYPPSGLDDDRNYFSKPIESGEGRLYLGLMPQSVSQASAVIAASSPILELPEVLAASGAQSRDAYWTAVMYHNSLRELGRTSTLVVDDVNVRLAARAERLGISRRQVRPDRVVELTSRRKAEELPTDLRHLGQSVESGDQAVDVVLSSNMLSVGIDVPRLALMLMVGQPRTTAEYIQATSRVGRGKVRGVVTTLFRSNRARDRSHFETFRSYHQSLYRSVEPTSVTPWSMASRDRSLAGALVLLIRHSLHHLAPNDSARALDLNDPKLKAAVGNLVDRMAEVVARSDKAEVDETIEDIRRLLNQWETRASDARRLQEPFPYVRSPGAETSLLKKFDQPGQGWVVADSMRSVEPNVAIVVKEPYGGTA